MAVKTTKGTGWKALRDDLLNKTGKTKQWLSAEVVKRTRHVAMPVRVAQAVVGHQNGVRISKYLSGADLAEVQQALRDLTPFPAPAATAGSARPASNRRRPGRSAAVPASRSLTFRGANVTTSDPFLPRAKVEEARAMANVYPLLYVLENSIREVIGRVMAARYGAGWWDTQMGTGRVRGVRDKVASRMTAEAANTWHQRRGAHPIDYTDFDDLLTIAESKPDVFFPVVIGHVDWFRQFFRELIPSRNVVAHMNPLSDTNEADVALKLQRWETHLTNRRAEIEAIIGAVATT